MLSEKDKYSDEVAALMALSRIHCVKVHDSQVLSTSELLEIFPWKELVGAKAEGTKLLL